MIDTLKLLLNSELALALMTLYFEPLFRSLHKRNWYTSCECGDQLWFPQTWRDVPPSHWQIWWVGFRWFPLLGQVMLCWKCHCFANERVVVLSDIGRLSPQADLDTWVSPLTWSLTMTALTWKVLKNSWVLKSSPFPAVLIRVYMWLSTTVRVERRLNCERERWVQCSVTLGQGCLNSVLEGQCPAEFRSNLPQHTCREVSSMPSKSLISWFRCVWLGLELNSAGHRPSRTESGHPCSRAYSVCLIFNMDFLFYPLQITNPLSPIPTFLFPSLLCQGNRGFFCLNYISSVCLFPPTFFFLLVLCHHKECDVATAQ